MATFRWDASSHSGMALMLNENSSAAAVEPDGTGAPMGETTDGSGGWLRRVIPISDVAGSTVSQIALGTSADTPAVVWDTYYANMVILHSDGSVSPIFTGQGASGALWNGCGSVAQSLSVDTMATTYPEINTTYYLSDHLGTTQMELSSGGWPLWQGWFTPFGQELGQPTPGPQNPDGTTMRFKFTGKERDAESGLDYFGARYYAASIGRFTSPDAMVDQQPVNPQSWNLYVYVRNNPLSNTDPTGNYDCGNLTGKECSDFGKILKGAQDALDEAKSEGRLTGAQYSQGSAAITAYGSLNDHNGVTINVGTPENGALATTGASNGGAVTEANPTGQNIQVTFRGDVLAGDLGAAERTVGHEGSHVWDAETWAKSGFDPAFSPSRFHTEFGAYGISTIFGLAQGHDLLTASRAHGENYDFWKKGNSDEVNAAHLSTMIRALYPNSQFRAFPSDTTVRPR